MPSYPHRYYFNAKSSRRTFAYQGEEIAIDQLLQDKEKVYIQPQPSGQEFSPKVLILNDFSAISWTSYKLHKLKTVFRELLQNQFRICYQKKNQWIELNADALDSLLDNYAKEACVDNNSTLLKAAVAPLNIPPESLLCLDYFELNFLMFDIDPETKTVYTSDFLQEYHPSYSVQQAYLANLEGLSIVDDTLNTINAVVPSVLRHLRLIRSRLQALQLSVKDSELSVEGGTQKFSSSSVKTIKLSGNNDNVDVELLHGFFGEVPNQVESLSIEGCSANLDMLSRCDWSKLTRFSYGESYNLSNREHALRIVAKAPALTHLELKIEAKDLCLSNISRVLETLNLSENRVNLPGIFNILEHNPGLKSLQIALETTRSEVIIRPFRLRSLALYGHHNSDETPQGLDLQYLLESLPSLQQLTFNNFDMGKGSTLKLKENSLPDLKSMNFEGLELFSYSHWRYSAPCLIAAAPNLEEIRGWPAALIPGLKLSKLHKVIWHGFISPERLNSLIACAPHLRIIEFRFTFEKDNSRWKQTDFHKLTHLQEIDLGGWTDRKHGNSNNFDGVNTAEYIICSAPQLKIIRVKNSLNAPDWIKSICVERGIALCETQARDTTQSKEKDKVESKHGDDRQIQAIEAATHHAPSAWWMDEYFVQHSRAKTPTLSSYLETLTLGSGRNQLVFLQSRELLNALMLHLEQFCIQRKQPIFIANQPNDLLCATRYMQQHEGFGSIEEGPGGRLYSFIQETKNKQPCPILVVNNDNFEVADNARFNTVFDPVSIRKADNVALPKSMIVIVLMNTSNPKTYKQADLLSRFEPPYRLPCPLNAEQILANLPTFNEAPETLDDTHSTLDFFDQDWRARLYGQWVMGERFTWREGAAQQLLEGQSSVVFKNIRILDDFDLQWQWSRTILVHAHRTGQKVQTYYRNDYDWNFLFQVAAAPIAMDAPIFLLNGRDLSKFFQHYEAHGSEMKYVQGIIEQHAGRQLRLYQTSPITLGNKARLLSECRQHQVLIELIKGPFPIVSDRVALHITDDVDYTLAEMAFNDDSIVIDISESEPSHLFGKTYPIYDAQRKTYRFQTTPSFLMTQLTNGKTVVLKGEFSAELVDSLARLLVHETSFSGLLILISTSSSNFNFFTPTRNHDASKEDKKVALLRRYPEHRTLIDNLMYDCPADEPYVKLCKRMSYLIRHAEVAVNANPYEFSEQNWDGLEKLKERSLVEIADVMGSRKQAVEAVLAEEPIVVLVGKTGGGKTEFVKRQYPGAYVGLSNLSEWIIKGQDERAILFIDEANISPSNWSMFEGLPHSIFWNGEYYPLTTNHKIIFAGNPYSYGGERKIATLFLRHGNTCIFDPLPAVFIAEQVLVPLFEHTSVLPQDVLGPILKAYRFVLDLPNNTVLVTPRELCTMVLLTISSCLAYPETSPQQIADFFAYNITKSMVFGQHAAEFIHQFPHMPSWQPRIEHTIVAEEFVLTDSRKIVLQLLEAFLRLRRFRAEPNRTKEQKISGLGVFLLEGEPAQGKSVLLDTVMQGVQPIYIPASMDVEEKKKQFLQAFRDGRAVRIDEMNTVAMFEKEMNTLLSGYDFENNEISEHPGFMVFVSQNPIILGGRRAMSNAEARRTFSWKLENYTEAELCHIVIHYGLDANDAQGFVSRFLMYVRWQLVNDETPYTIRELKGMVEDIVRRRCATAEMPNMSVRPQPSDSGLPANPIRSIVFALEACITSNRYILFKTLKKSDKDTGIADAMNELNQSIRFQNINHIKERFIELCKNVCRRRNTLSTLCGGIYSTKTQSAIYLANLVVDNVNLLHILHIEIDRNREITLSNIHQWMKDACDDNISSVSTLTQRGS